MKKKFDFRIILIIALIIILISMICLYVVRNATTNNINSLMNYKTSKNETNTTKSSNTTTITSSGEIKSNLTEKIQLHATYYYSEIYVSENQKVNKGENILKYTNGTFETAPYDCIVVSYSLPETDGKVTNTHYVEIEATNTLKVSFKVSESKINSINLGDVAKIEISAISETIEGIVTNISSTADKGNFTVKVEFENDGNIKIGMGSKVTIETN